MFRYSSSSRTTLSGIPLPRFFTRSRRQRSSGSVKVCKLKPPPSRDRSALTANRNPSAVDGTTINFSLLSWAVKPPGQDSRNQARKARVSRTSEIKMGVLLGRSSAGRQVLVTWVFRVLPSGVSLRGPDMSLDMGLLAVSDETAGSDMSESMAVGLSDPLGCLGATGPSNAAAYVTPPSGGPICRLPKAACSPVTEVKAGRGAHPAPGAGRLLAVSVEPPELTSSLALRFSALRLGGCWEALAPPLSMVPRLPADTTVLFSLLEARAVLSSVRRAGEGCIVETAFIQANSSCLSMMLKQETCKEERNFSVIPSVVASNTGLENQYLLPVDSTQTGSVLSGHSTQQLLYSQYRDPTRHALYTTPSPSSCNTTLPQPDTNLPIGSARACLNPVRYKYPTHSNPCPVSSTCL